MFTIVPTESSDFTHKLIGRPDSEDPTEGSVEKWATVVLFLMHHPGAIVDDGGWTTCPLCALYYDCKDECDGCPIADEGYGLCEGTPYTDYIVDWSPASAQAELNFLHEVQNDSQ